MRRFKKILAFIFIIGFIFTLTSCVTLVNDEITLTEEKVKFTNYASDYDIKSEELTIYYVDDSKIPYVDFTTFFAELSGFFDTENMYFYMISFYRQITLTYRGLGVALNIAINFDKDFIHIDDTYALNLVQSSSTTDYSRLLQTSDDVLTNMNFASLRFECSELGYDFYYYDNMVIVPFSLMNFLFCSYNYYNIYYNGEAFYGDYLIIRDQEHLNEVYKEELVGKEATKEEREDNYRLMKFVFHYFYGLGDKLEVLESDYKEDLLSTDPEVYTKAEYSFINTYLNELHSGVIHSPYSINHSTYDKEPYYSEKYKEELEAVSALREAKKARFGDEAIPYLRFKDNLAIVYLEGFETGENEQIFNEDGSVKDTAYSYDTFYLLKKVFSEIETHEEVTDVLIDLSLNGGGNLAALIRSLAFLTNEEVRVASYDGLSGRIIRTKYKVDLQEDGSYSQKSYQDKYDFYVLTSMYTYSSANIFAANTNYFYYGDVVGQQSGGGACSIIAAVMPDGLTFQMSGPNQMIILEDENERTFTPTYIEAGVELNDSAKIPYEHFFDDEYLCEFINSYTKREKPVRPVEPEPVEPTETTTDSPSLRTSEPATTTKSAPLTTTDKEPTTTTDVTNPTTTTASLPTTSDNPNTTTTEAEEMNLVLKIDGIKVDVTWENNASVTALKELAKDGLNLTLNQYSGFEQTGLIGQDIVSNDEWIDVDFGDVVLYNSKQICLYYNHNAYNFTRLGKINLTKEELVALLDKDSVEISLTLE